MKQRAISKLEVTDQTDWSRVDAMHDADIDFSDNPAWSEADFLNAKQRDLQQTPIKLSIYIHLSSDIVEFFKATGNDWQAHMENALREYMTAHQR